MTIKENPNVIGEIMCPAPNCTHVAEVRQREKGKKLKYLYCPVHKVNQIAGDDFQTFIDDNMAERGILKQTVAAEPENMAQPEPNLPNDEPVDQAGMSIIPPTEEVFRPQPKKSGTSNKPEPKPIEQKTEKSTISTVHVVCGVAFLCVIGVGIWYFLAKKTPANPTSVADEAQS